MAPLVKNQIIELVDKKYIKEQIYPKVMKHMQYTNHMQLPRITAIHVSMGTGRKVDIKMARRALTSIAGQAPADRKAKRSVSAYGIRQGMVIGIKVTLRNWRMYCFIQTLVNVVLPSISSFVGLRAESMQIRKNVLTISLGIRDITLFPGADIPPAQQLGCGITMVMKGTCKESAIMFLEHMGIPFRSNNNG